MKSFKHVISYACDKRCSYCINEILKHDEKQCKDKVQIGEKYTELALDGYDHIMLSGGEPVLNKMFESCLRLASMIFKHVSIISAHNSTLSNKLIEELADDVLFSLHAEYFDSTNIPQVNIDIPVYASMILETYHMIHEVGNLFHLSSKGFSGATIRECYPDGDSIEKFYPDGFGELPNNFSLKTYTKDRCVMDSLLLLPDLSTTTQEQFA